jgi:probable HAF family extracellular repeat protein
MWSSANAVNASGQIVGTSLNGDGVSTAFFSNGNGMSSLCLTCPASSYGNALNSAGTAVGSFVNHDGFLHASQFSGGNAIDLGTLGGFQSVAYGVDEAGDIVGNSYLSDNTTVHAFVYSNNIMVDLNSLLPIASGWTITSAYGVNALGDVVGVGMQGGQAYAVSLVPTNTGLFGPAPAVQGYTPAAVPEPAPFLLTGATLALFSAGLWLSRMRGSLTKSTRPIQSKPNVTLGFLDGTSELQDHAR